MASRKRVSPGGPTELATEMLYPMHIMSVVDFLERYASGDRKLESHQKLKKLGLVTETSKELLEGAELIFVSHEWTGFMHPDPNGHQTRELCLFLQRLRSGAIASVARIAWGAGLPSLVVSTLLSPGEEVVLQHPQPDWQKKLVQLVG